jgi:hypothetical protein
MVVQFLGLYLDPPVTQSGSATGRGVPRIFARGDAHFWLTYPPPPPHLDPDPDEHQDFELDPDPAPDPHQNNADPQPWAQMSKDCCQIYNYV